MPTTEKVLYVHNKIVKRTENLVQILQNNVISRCVDVVMKTIVSTKFKMAVCVLYYSNLETVLVQLESYIKICIII